jgi:U3 small nucleolar ribonucleoprotein protein IMP3
VAKILRRYHIQDRNDYTAYHRLCGMVTKLAAKLKSLPPDDTFRMAMTDQLLQKLYDLGVIDTTSSLQKAEPIAVSQLCRRRLPVIMVRLKMAETITAAVTWIEQGQVRVGATVVTDPAFLVSRQDQDYVTYVGGSEQNSTSSARVQ